MVNPLCRVELFGGLRLVTPTQTVTHFRTRKTALLLAYLAANLRHTHPRETLIDLLWEDSDIETGRLSLRVALSSLRKQFEQAGVPPQHAFHTDNFGIGLRPGAVTTDLREMEQSIRLAHHATSTPERITYLQRAVDGFTAPPLKGFYEEWVLQLQRETAEQFFRTLGDLIRLLEGEGHLNEAQQYALRGIASDPLREEPRMALMRIYLAMGYPMEARRVYRDWETLVQEELGTVPSRQMYQLARQAETVSQQSRESARALCESYIPPTAVTLFGRKRELEQLMEMLRSDTTRLITITGDGGIGKTSLAIEVARRVVGLGQRVWFVDLADVREGHAVLECVLRTAGVVAPSEPPWDRVVQALGDYPSLLVLDNCEQLDASVANIASELLHRLPLLQILVTSRRRTGLPGERVLRLGPLQTPDTGCWRDERAQAMEGSVLKSVESCPSVQLFVQHAQTVRAGFRLSAENASAIAGICAHLEGLPLAIILAACRTRVLSPAQILQALQNQTHLLSKPYPSQPERHGSLHASLEWTYALLSPELEKAFTMLSVFAGGWDLAGATSVLTGHVTGEGGAMDVAVLDTLDALIECSLVQTEEREGQTRYRMLEVVRSYALEKLKAEPYAPDAFARHFAFYSQLAEQANENRLGSQAAWWASRVALEHQNMVKALGYMLDRDTSRGDWSALQMAANLWVFWMMRGVLVEGRELLERLVASYRDAEGEQMSCWWSWTTMGAGALAWMQRDLSAANDLLRQSLSRFEQQGDPEGQAFASIWLGNVMYRMGDSEQAEAAYTRGLELAEQAGSIEAQTYATMWLGNMAQRAGELHRARTRYHSCLRLAQGSADQYALGFVHYNLGQIALREGNHDECAQQLVQCLQTRARIDDQPGFLEAVEAFATLCAHAGWDTTGVQLLGVSESLRQRLHLPSVPSHLRETEQTLRIRTGEQAYQQYLTQGRSLSLQEAVSLVETLFSRKKSQHLSL